MAFDAFSEEWVHAWAEALNRSEAYQTAAAKWEGAVALVLEGDESRPAQAVLLDLWHGRCRSARTADPDHLADAAYVFRGNLDSWKKVLTGSGSPAMALMTGQIRVTQGSLAGLLPYVRAAQALLQLACQVPARFPEG